MARARNIKPQFFHDAELIECEHWVRLLFAGLWTLADRDGRLLDKPKQIAVDLFPREPLDIDAGLNELQAHGLIVRYEVDDLRLIWVKNFNVHQNPHYKEEPSKLPPPPGWAGVPVVASGPSPQLRQEILDRDGKCLSCGSIEDLTLDHITPRVLGGTDQPDNLQTLCRRCNSAKNNRQASSYIEASSANHEPTSANDPRVNRADSRNLIPDCPNQQPATAREDVLATVTVRPTNGRMSCAFAAAVGKDFETIAEQFATVNVQLDRHWLEQAVSRYEAQGLSLPPPQMRQALKTAFLKSQDALGREGNRIQNPPAWAAKQIETALRDMTQRRGAKV